MCMGNNIIHNFDLCSKIVIKIDQIVCLIAFCLLVTYNCPCPQTLILSVRLMHVLICLCFSNCLIVYCIAGIIVVTYLQHLTVIPMLHSLVFDCMLQLTRNALVML